MNDKEKFDYLLGRVILCFQHGSSIYGTASEESDVDLICVVPDSCEELLDDGFGQFFFQLGKIDYQFISESKWMKYIQEHHIDVFEAFSLPDDKVYVGHMCLYRKFLNFDKWMLRQSLSARSNNSWAKAHKKMTVEKDLDVYVGKKSLFHSIRIFDFGKQIAEQGRVVDFSSMNWLWKEIDGCPETDWEYYKKKYKPLYNRKRSEFVELCPKPVE